MRYKRGAGEDRRRWGEWGGEVRGTGWERMGSVREDAWSATPWRDELDIDLCVRLVEREEDDELQRMGDAVVS